MLLWNMLSCQLAQVVSIHCDHWTSDLQLVNLDHFLSYSISCVNAAVLLCPCLASCYGGSSSTQLPPTTQILIAWREIPSVYRWAFCTTWFWRRRTLLLPNQLNLWTENANTRSLHCFWKLPFMQSLILEKGKAARLRLETFSEVLLCWVILILSQLANGLEEVGRKHSLKILTDIKTRSNVAEFMPLSSIQFHGSYQYICFTLYFSVLLGAN